MSDDNMDELVSFVLSDMATSVPASFQRSIDGIVAPLARLIEEFLQSQPGIRFHEYLEAIARLNQGRLEDLSIPLFRSYVIRKTQMGEDILNKCVDELQSYWRLRGLANDLDAALLMAARDDEGDGGARISVGDLLGQLAKRSQ